MKISIKRWNILGTNESRLTFKWWGGRLNVYQRAMLLKKLPDGVYEIINGTIRRISDVE